MNYFECCHYCVAPKRYPGCSDKCPEYAAGKAKLEADKEKQKNGIALKNYIGERRVAVTDSLAKRERKYRKYKPNHR